MIRINLGCGKDIRNGWINVDKIDLDGVDVVHDLDVFPWPFDTASVDRIRMDNSLEHLNDVVAVIEELYRVLKPGGIVCIRVPLAPSHLAFMDPTHKHFFTKKSIHYFIDGHKYGYYSQARFILVSESCFRVSFPVWHIKKYLGLHLYFPLFPDMVEWVIKKC